MGPAEPNYFTCTLGQAAAARAQHAALATVVALVDERARRAPAAPALGFAGVPPGAVSFRALRDGSVAAAQALSAHVPEQQQTPAAVGLLCNSSLDFVLTWLGLMRLGLSVLLLAPQLQPQAMEHLCAALQVDVVFVSESQHQAATRVGGGIRLVKMPLPPCQSRHRAQSASKDAGNVSDIAYFFHTSGTSSGLPKPIPQSQAGVVRALPCFPDQGNIATFSTTPLYHGGLADCLRAWASGAAIWLFPEGRVPVTAATVSSAVAAARSQSPVRVGYFSSVPYVLQMLAQTEDGIRLLQTMDLVGVGGAALPAAIGDELVGHGVRLLSRFGSAECGFLMSSHRDYSRDTEWQYLRPVDDTRLLSFEPRDDGLFEAVVKPGWPFKAKTNRPDGSYATADLFEPHPSRANQWRYHSRADAQITLANGKKFDPSPMEADILASTRLLQDVCIFGTGKPYAGVLLFPASNKVPEEDVMDAAWPCIDKMNSTAQSHTRISRSMLVVEPVPAGQAPLDKSSKGTTLRRRAEQRYEAVIEAAYDEAKCLAPSAGHATTADHQLLSTVSSCFARVLGRQVDAHKDLYQQGVDSIACIQIRKLIASTCLARSQQRLPMNVIYDRGTVAALVAYLRGQDGDDKGDRQLHQSMRELADKYSQFQFAGPRKAPGGKQGTVVVLTGATGFLGAYMLHLLCRDQQVDKVYCLVRCRTPCEAHERVSKALSKRGLTTMVGSKVACLSCDVAKANLGWSEQDRQRVLQDATVVIHSAWTVNFNLGLDSFEDQIAGTRNLINMATESGARLVFISSTAAVSHSASATVAERVSEDASEASPLGYARSKWVAERVCAAANTSAAVSIIRVGQLCGDESGAWNASEAYPLMLSTAGVTGGLPDLPNEALSWLPVEVAAQAVLDIALSDQGTATSELGIASSSDLDAHDSTQPPPAPTTTTTTTPVHHVLNPHDSPTWSQMLQCMSQEPGRQPFAILGPAEWVRRLEESRMTNHPSQALLGLWKEQFGEGGADRAPPAPAPRAVFQVSRAQQVSPTMRRVKPLDRQRLARMWQWVEENVGRRQAGEGTGSQSRDDAQLQQTV